MSHKRRNKLIRWNDGTTFKRGFYELKKVFQGSTERAQCVQVVPVLDKDTPQVYVKSTLLLYGMGYIYNTL